MYICPFNPMIYSLRYQHGESNQSTMTDSFWGHGIDIMADLQQPWGSIIELATAFRSCVYHVLPMKLHKFN